MQQLPAEVLLAVFAHCDGVSLCRCATVCSEWSDLVDHSLIVWAQRPTVCGARMAEVDWSVRSCCSSASWRVRWVYHGAASPSASQDRDSDTTCAQPVVDTDLLAVMIACRVMHHRGSSRGAQREGMDYALPSTIAELRVFGEAVCSAMLKNEVVASIEAPVNVLGDIHGQFDDLARWLLLLGVGPQHCAGRLLVLGDIADRGPHSFECLLLLFALKVLHPSSIVICRGKHEFPDMWSVYGTEDEIHARFHDAAEILEVLGEICSHMPVMARVDGDILCMHGGPVAEPAAECSHSVAAIGYMQRPYQRRDLPVLFNLAAAELGREFTVRDAVEFSTRAAARVLIRAEYSPRGYFYHRHTDQNDLRDASNGNGEVEGDGDVLMVSFFSAPAYMSATESGVALHVQSATVITPLLLAPHPLE